MIVLICAFLESFCCSSPETDGRKDGDLFRVRAEVIIAIEDGPVILKITSTYLGVRPLVLDGRTDCHTAIRTVSSPGTFQVRQGYRVGEQYLRRIQPGDEIVDIVHLRQNSDPGHFPAGSFQWEVVWWAYRAKDKGEKAVEFNGKESYFTRELRERLARKLTSVEVPLKITVIRANENSTQENIRFLRSLLEKRDKSSDDLEILYQHVNWNRRPAYQSIAFALLRMPEYNKLQKEIVTGILHSEATTSVKTDLMIKYLTTEDPTVVVPVFQFWFRASNRDELTKQDYGALASARSPWVRMCLYLFAADKCDSKWVEELLREVGSVYKPIPRQQIQQTLKDLDSDSFKTRQDATKKLIQFREAIIPALLEELTGNPSTEVRSRIDTVIKEIKRLAPTQFEKEFFGLLYPRDWTKSYPAHYKRLLIALSANVPEGCVAREARQMLKVVDYVPVGK